MRKYLHEELLQQRLTVSEAQMVERHPVSLMLVNIRSLYNVGSMFRTADSALAEEMILTGFTPHPPRKEIEKTALGAVETVPWNYHKEPLEAIHAAKKSGKKCFAVELTDSSRDYSSLTKEDFPMCLVLGNEITGIDNDILAECDEALEIPMFGVKHSLNVGVATGIVLFEAVRAWRQLS